MRARLACLGAALRRFLADSSGNGTIGGLFWTVTATMISGVAIDGANGRRVQFQMQVAADAAALAAAVRIDDVPAARSLALEAAARNLGTAGVIRPEDIVFGRWDEGSDRFTPDARLPDAVQVVARRSEARGNALSTYLLGLVGVPRLNIAASGLARARPAPPESACAGAMILSSGTLDAGGNNSYSGAVCLHGRTGVRMGGNDWFSSEVRLSAQSRSDVFVPHVRQGSSPAEAVTMARNLTPVIVPRLGQIWAERWALFAGSASAYSGHLFPAFLRDPATSEIRLVRKSGWWTVQQGQLDPYTVYLVDGGVQFAGNVDARNVGFVVNGPFGVGGGQSLIFDDFYAIGTQLNLAGNVTWGSAASACGERRYSVYLFGTQSLSLGGWGKAASIHGMIGAAPQFNPGGAMTATGVYFETTGSWTSLGGNMTLQGCPGDPVLSAEVETARPASVPRMAGALLVR